MENESPRESSALQQALALFDQCADLSASDQQAFLDNAKVPPDVSRWLKKLLEGDQQSTGLVDQSAENIAAQLLAQEEGAGLSPVSTDHWIGQQLGNYRIVEELGRGGMSVVMRAERADGRFSQNAAIKLIRPDEQTNLSAERLAQETQILGRLKHPNIAYLIDAGISSDGTAYAAMEHCPGLSLIDYCTANALSIADRLQLMKSVCQAVQHAHSKLIVHRDLKPSNILVQQDGTPKLIDFGIAGILNRASNNAQWATALTPEYAAPEQFSNDQATTAMDVYALGSLLYECVVGERPFDSSRKNLSKLQAIKSNNDFTRPSEKIGNQRKLSKQLEGDLDAIIGKAMAGDPAARYVSAQALADDIDRHLSLLPVDARNGRSGYRFGRWFLRNRIAATLGVVAVVGVLGGLAGALWQAQTAQRQAARAEAVQGFLLDMFRAADPYLNQQNPITVNSLISDQADKINSAFPEQEDIRQSLQRTLAEVNERLGNHEAAESIYRDLLGQYEGSNANKFEQGQLYAQLAGQLVAKGDLEKATEAVQQAIELTSENRTDVAAFEARQQLAKIQVESRRHEEAIATLESLVEQRDAIAALPEGPQLMARLLSDLSERKGYAGDVESALELHAQAMPLYRQHFPEQHPDVANAILQLSGIYRFSGQFAEAVTPSYQAAVMNREIFGLNHTTVLRSDTTFAVDLAYLKCIREAMGVYDGIIERYRSLYGENHELTASALINQASFKRRAGEYESALEDIDQTLAVYGRGDAKTDLLGYAQGIRSSLLFHIGRTDEALVQSGIALETMQAAVGEAHPSTMQIQSTHGWLLFNRGDVAAAQPYLEGVVTQLTQTFGADAPPVKTAAVKWIAALQALGRNEEAQRQISQHSLDQTTIDKAVQSGVGQPIPASECQLPSAVDVSAFALSG